MTKGQAIELADSADAAGTSVRARPDLRLANGERKINMAAAERAAGEFLAALGVELDAEALRETPGRMARAYAELFDSPTFRLTTFPNDEGWRGTSRSAPSASTICCLSPVSRMSATCPASASSGCRN